MRRTSVPAVFLGLLFFSTSVAFAEPATTSADPQYQYYSPAPDAEADATTKALDDAEKALPGGHFKMSGKYRVAAGATTEDFILNDANADQQEKNFRYLFGERLNNNYDPGIYSQYLLNLDFSPTDRVNFYTQIVNDPWSWVGTTGEQVQVSDIGGEVIRYNLKYFGAQNSTIPEIYRTNVADSVGFPAIKVRDGQLTPGTVAHGFYDFNPSSNGIPFTVPELDIDYEYRPIRKLWMDYTEDDWHARVFALADESQALTTDDPLGLSNHKDYWQQSPWLYQYQPVMHFTDSSIRPGFYDDSLSYLARDTEGNRLVLLRGASVEADFGDTYLAGTVAAPFTPWDEEFFEANNIPGAFRIKRQVTDGAVLGGTYTFRSGLVNDELADFGQAGGVDLSLQYNEHSTLKGQVAFSHREHELTSDDAFQRGTEGYAYKGEWTTGFDHENIDRRTDLRLTYTQMDQQFDPLLSRYVNTRDDHFWGNHISFHVLDDDLEYYYKIGDGVDRNRIAVRAQWREKLFKERFQNYFDVRNVHKTSNTAYMETVLRDEITYKIDERWTAKGLFRWHGLPSTTGGVEPFLANFYFPGYEDPSSILLQNIEVLPDQDADRFTYAAALQYVLNDQWTFEGFYERTNNIPDFPRGLLNGAFRNSNTRVEGILMDRVTTFLYGQGSLKALPPYDYFNIFRERIIFSPLENLKFTFHAAQNGYKFSGGIDDNINHEGISAEFAYNEKLTLFFDYTHSRVIDVPRLIATSYAISEFDEHHNIYASLDYKINSSTVFRSEYGVFGLGANSPQVTPYSTSGFSLPTLDTEHLLRVSLNGDF